RAKPLNSEYVESPPRFQKELIVDLVERVIPPSPDAPAVCLLDTGIAHAHPLLAVALDPDDAQALDPSWGTHDDHPHRHGTTMAGIALYGSLSHALQSSDSITLNHRLESVKILSPTAGNNPEAYGSLTQEAIARIESLQPH